MTATYGPSVTAAVNAILTAPNRTALDVLCARAFAAGAHHWRVEQCRGLWLRNQPCATCGHLGTYHHANYCVAVVCGCSGHVAPTGAPETVTPDQESAEL